MTNKLDLFRCKICGNIVEVVISGGGTLVCCGENMERLAPADHDEGEEKHVPVLENNGLEKTVRIGSMPHPMTNEHYIQFIEVISKDNNWVKRKYLRPEQPAEMKFKCECKDGFSAVEYCNIHGLWGANFNEGNNNGQQN